MDKEKVNNYFKSKLEGHAKRWLEVDQQINLRARAREERMDSLYEESETREGRIVGGKPIGIVHEALVRGALIVESIPPILILYLLSSREDGIDNLLMENRNNEQE